MARKAETVYIVRDKRSGEEHEISPAIYTKIKGLVVTKEFFKVRDGIRQSV